MPQVKTTSMISRFVLFMFLVAAANVMVGCGAKDKKQIAYQAALINRDVGESAYKAVYKGWRVGAVPVEVKDQAKGYYDDWVKSSKLLAAAMSATTGDPTLQRLAAEKALVLLLDLSEEWTDFDLITLLQDKSKESRNGN